MKVKLHRYVLYGLLLVLSACLRQLPLSWVSVFGKWIGLLSYFLLGRERKRALLHLSWAFGKEKTQKEIRALTKRIFANLGRNFTEWQKMPALTSQEIQARVEVQNFEVITEALKKGKGVIFLTAHLGNWEWSASYVSSLGYPVHVLAKRIYFEPYNQFLTSLRRSHNVEIIYQDDSPKKILKVLAQNEVLGVLPDQDVDKVNGVFVPFFGKEAYTPTGPVALAMASGAALIPAFIVRGKKKFKLIFEEPLEIKRTGNKEEDLKRHTLEWTQILERYIRKYPDQWVWMHRRWRTQKNKETVGSK